MKRTAISLLILLIFLTAAATAAAGSQPHAYGFLMAEEPVGPRNAAMGSVGAALPGSGFRYYNPAQPFFSAQPYAAAEFGQMPGGVNRGGFESAVIFPEWFTAISFHTSSVDFETRDEKGFGSPASSGTTFGALGVGYIRGNLSLAASVNMADDRIWVSSNYSAVAFSAGAGYKALDGRLNLGAAWLNGAAWGRGFGEGGDTGVWQGGRVPAFARAGAAWSGAVGQFPYTVAADVAYRDEDGTVSVPVGAEVRVLPYVSLRIGKRIGWESEILSLGIGFNLDRISFDAAFVPSVFVSDYEIKWNMGFTYRMGGRRKPAESAKSAEPPKSTVSMEPSDSGAPTEPSATAETVDSAKSIGSSDSTEPGDTAAGPAESSVDTQDDDAESIDSTEEPSEPANPAIPPESSSPVDSEGSAGSAKPSEPKEPTAVPPVGNDDSSPPAGSGGMPE